MGTLKDYTRKDMKEIREYLVSLVDELCEKYGNFWTDRNESDLGMFFIELAAGIGDLLNFNIDKNALETFLPTAKQRKNIKKILTLINYEMLPPVPAVTSVTFSLNDNYKSAPGANSDSDGLNFDLIIPKYTQLVYSREKGNIYYATSEDCILLRNTLLIECPVMQGIVKNVANLTVNFLKNNRLIEINSEKVAYNSVRLIVGETEWTRVDDVLLDEHYGTKFSVHENEKDHPYIEFHYTWKNFLPTDTSTPILIQYVDTEGSKGQVPANTLTSIVGNILMNGIDYSGYLSVMNEEASSGGSERENIATAKIKAPKYIKACHTMCTLEDYEAFTDVQPGVYKSKAVDWNISYNGIQSYYVSIPYRVIVYVVSNDYNNYICTQEFLNEIYDRLKPKLWSSIKLSIEQAPIAEIDISARVYTRTVPGNFSKIEADIQDTILNFFKKVNRDFGESFTVGTIEHLINSANSMIDYCELDSQDETIKLEPIQFPKLGNLDLTIIQEV